MFYIPMIVFFTWIIVFTVLTVKAINAEAAAEQRATPATPERVKTGAAAR